MLYVYQISSFSTFELDLNFVAWKLALISAITLRKDTNRNNVKERIRNLQRVLTLFLIKNTELLN